MTFKYNINDKVSFTRDGHEDECQVTEEVTQTITAEDGTPKEETVSITKTVLKPVTDNGLIVGRSEYIDLNGASAENVYNIRTAADGGRQEHRIFESQITPA